MRWRRRGIIWLAIVAVILGCGLFYAFTFLRGLWELKANKYPVLVYDMAVKLEDYRRETGDYPHTPAEAFELAKERINGGVEIALRGDGAIRMKSQRQTVDVTYEYLGPDLPPLVRWKRRHWGLW
jgi:hypothetical protein